MSFNSFFQKKRRHTRKEKKLFSFILQVVGQYQRLSKLQKSCKFDTKLHYILRINFHLIENVNCDPFEAGLPLKRKKFTSKLTR